MASASFYTEIISTYVRLTGSLGPKNAGNASAEVLIRHCLSAYTTSSTICSRYTIKSVSISGEDHADLQLILFELEGTAWIHGILFQAPEIDTRANLRNYFAYTVLLHLERDQCDHPESQTAPSDKLNSQIAEIFEHTLLYDVNDKYGWLASGKAYCASRVSYFTSKCAPVRFALPSFPCATTNPDKKASALPEGTEYEALSKILDFCRRIRYIYPPGCEFYIVSDGHVFSDCTGADDCTVTAYTRRLKAMAEEVSAREDPDGPYPLRFRDLFQILFPNSTALTLFEKASRTECLDEVVHPVQTAIIAGHDMCRRSLLATCAPPKSYVKDLLEYAPDHDITALYRGFARFMVDDLASKLDALCTTGKQRKRMAETVAREMIVRNQAYSRLVETTMPFHVRLSIHAYNNTAAEKKFAVRLLPFAPVLDLSSTTEEDAKEESVAHLHVPTPWHNSLVEVHCKGSVRLATCKAVVVQEALKNGWEGGYAPCHARGGRFVI